jgi:hypothetical protein
VFHPAIYKTRFLTAENGEKWATQTRALPKRPVFSKSHRDRLTQPIAATVGRVDEELSFID